MASLESRSPAFKSAADYMTSAPEASKTSNDVKLELYGLYKYLTVGHKPTSSCPSIFDMSGRAKWKAWDGMEAQYAGKTDVEVEDRYLEIARQFGWKESAGEAAASAMAHPPAETEGKHGVGMGVSVSAIARPPEDAKEPENSIHSLVLTGEVDKVKEALDKEGSSADLDTKDDYGFTALQLAADRGHLEIVKLLVSKGANIGVKDPDGLTAISLAEAADRKDIVAFLEDFLADKGGVGQGA
ncbi:hypothetical protein FRB90_009149 [Tulasnella sp. 427]|nr:hypothetical protein FRB90_009149 [Tulasnella sp. 427]